MIPTPDWDEPCMLTQTGGEDMQGPLAELVLFATRVELPDRPDYLLISAALGEVDNEQLEELRRRPDFPLMA
ncbi:hypothetical protein HL653_16290 [Sphingomonas sp. AP4-R1]|uniref:hypothetical protein n=1 Tax=Sphingomonas sp. AP4-R1 TaxID=2735134 RepID=UPI001493BBAA|nr:hypothetical protein [Sphingomonas sp. AP4-R1]QJU59110.1 hypothetical protein HL653_16290 [Sphingomonas sp. AP4-R1]